ncbi:hypothetical protein L484_003075 [Morus notabilis]|uniref:Uncharacterized protein n=1 Tax=Morus notabilis TaxID=981085 RepID=W9S2J4_9ROSA|nr:hypothetical protein L484_003075 [Morus notabilis]
MANSYLGKSAAGVSSPLSLAFLCAISREFQRAGVRHRSWAWLWTPGPMEGCLSGAAWILPARGQRGYCLSGRKRCWEGLFQCVLGCRF